MHASRREFGARCFYECLKAKEQQGDIISVSPTLRRQRSGPATIEMVYG